MPNDLSPVKQTLPATPFRWRDRFGVFHAPKDMDTGHLFHATNDLESFDARHCSD